MVDYSVLVQDADTGECVPQARVMLRLTARKTGAVSESPATVEASTNKLYLAAVFRLPEPDWWDVDISIEGPRGPARLQFGVKVDEALPRWQELWPWFAWPALVVVIFSVHRALAARALRLNAARPIEGQRLTKQEETVRFL
jgi:hypothetical protein